MVFVFWLLGIIAVMAIGLLLVLLVKFLKYATIINKIPGPNALYFIKNAQREIKRYEDLANFMAKMLRQQQMAGHSIIRLWLGPFPKVVILKGSSCEVILKNSKYVNKSKEYEFARNMLGNGLLFSKKELWEKRRKMINPSFHVSVIKEFFPIFNDQIAICLQKFKEVDDGRIFDVVPYFRYLALDMICETTMGVKINAQENYADEFVKAHHKIGDLFSARASNPFLHPNFIYNWTRYKKMEIRYCNIIHTFALKVIRERVKYLERCKLQQNIQNGVERADEQEIFGEKRRVTTLDLLIEGTCDGRKLTDHELLDEVIIQIAAGHETTSDSIAFAVYLMGRNLEAQKIAQQEVDNILGKSERPVTSDDLLNLKYLEAVIKESYRLYPPISQMARVMDEDVVIGDGGGVFWMSSKDGYTIPAGTTVAMVIYVIHRDPKVFPDPDKFDPERFLGANINGPSIYEYMPFSQGPRNCIGYKMGIWETKMALAKILQKYDIISHDKPEDLKMAVSPDLRSYHGLKISLHKRN